MSDQKEKNEPLDLLQLLSDADGKGIACPKCECRHWYVRNTVPGKGAITRYRVCRNCQHVRRTVERAG